MSRLPLPPLPLIVALLAGAITVIGFAPFAVWPAGLLTLFLLNSVLASGSPREGFWRGFAFGLGLLGFGVFWIRISLNEFGNLGPWTANTLMALFVAGMALYYGLMGWLVRRLAVANRWVVPLLLLPGLYVLLEWLRGWLMTGFPWLNLGYTQIGGPLAGYAPVVGVYGLSLLTVLAGGLLWGLWRWTWGGRVAAGLALAGIGWGGLTLQAVEWTQPDGPPFTAAVVQANIPQSLKWEPAAKREIMQVHRELTQETQGAALVLWPETAIPDFLHEVGDWLLEVAEGARAQGQELVLGIPVLDPETGRYYNALISMGSAQDLYAKRHLVPFGEFLPFKSWLGPLVRLFEVPMSDFSPGDSAQPLLQVGGRTAGVSICYEDAFPTEVSQALPAAGFLIGVSNDAWFGNSLAPHQHLEMARMRALETGRDLVRATNTGVSAIVDRRGQVQVEVPLFQRGTATAPVQPRTGATPFVQWGNWPALGLALAALAGALLARWRLAARAGRPGD